MDADDPDSLPFPRDMQVLARRSLGRAVLLWVGALAVWVLCGDGKIQKDLVVREDDFLGSFVAACFATCLVVSTLLVAARLWAWVLYRQLRPWPKSPGARALPVHVRNLDLLRWSTKVLWADGHLAAAAKLVEGIGGAGAFLKSIQEVL